MNAFMIQDQPRRVELPQLQTDVLFIFRLKMPEKDVTPPDLTATHLRMKTPAGFYTNEQCRVNFTTQYHLVFDESTKPDATTLLNQYAQLPVLDENHCNATFLGTSQRNEKYRSQPGEGQRQEILLQMGTSAAPTGPVSLKQDRFYAISLLAVNPVEVPPETDNMNKFELEILDMSSRTFLTRRSWEGLQGGFNI